MGSAAESREESAAVVASAKRTAKHQALEAVLLLASEPLSSRKLSQYANLADGTEALTLIRQLNGFYDQEKRAFRVEQLAGGYQLMTRPALADWLRRLAGTPPEVRLSAPAMETLVVVAYRQPVMRAEIESIRGVACGELLRQLMDRELVRICGRSDELGRPFLYGTTSRFLRVFGLGSLEDLPRAAALGRAARDTNSLTIDQSTSGSKEGLKVLMTVSDILEADAADQLGGAVASDALPSDDRLVAVDDDDDDDFDDDDD
ncbi:MAG: SMC-Scp complex subunit ScpB, partial [Planctomycetales bacterium]|nr:SMC-Scp complex subunit ScpB [Planctomycetales bacterium]